MPHLIVTRGAAAGLARCEKYLLDRDPQAAARAGQIIRNKLDPLRNHPAIGRQVSGSADLRELVIGFGRSGYIALYRYVSTEDAVYILAVRHQRESHY